MALHTSFAVEIQILPLQATGIDAPLQASAQALVQAAVLETGNTPVSDNRSVQLRTTLLKLETQWIVIAEKLEQGVLTSSTKLKAGSADELDIVIARSVRGALQQTSATQNEEVGAITTPETESMAKRKAFKGYKHFAGGPGLFHGLSSSDVVYNVRAGGVWELSPHAAVTSQFHGAWQMTRIGVLFGVTGGGRWYPSAGRITPYIGGGLGIGMAADRDDSWFGFAGTLEAGWVFFRTSDIQVDAGIRSVIVLDGVDNGAPAGLTGVVIGVNY